MPEAWRASSDRSGPSPASSIRAHGSLGANSSAAWRATSWPFSRVNAAAWPMTKCVASRNPSAHALGHVTPGWVIAWGISMPGKITSMCESGTPAAISTCRTDCEFAITPWHVRPYFQRWIIGCRGVNATWRLATRRTGRPREARKEMVCALASCACTISNCWSRRRERNVPAAW